MDTPPPPPGEALSTRSALEGRSCTILLLDAQTRRDALRRRPIARMEVGS